MKGQTRIVAEPLDITWLEQTWEVYIRSVKYRDPIGKLNLSSLMGEQTGEMLQEIRTLRTQVKDLQVQVNGIETELQNAYDYYDP